MAMTERRIIIDEKGNKSQPVFATAAMQEPVNKTRNTKIINLFGGPGSGKSTTAYLLAGSLKQNGHSAELVTEYAKDCVWRRSEAILDDQAYVTAKQWNRIHRLIGKVDFIITDSPILLGIIYKDLSTGTPDSLVRLILDHHFSCPSMNIFIDRPEAYDPEGRLQTEIEAKAIDRKILTMLSDHGVGYTRFGLTKKLHKKLYKSVTNDRNRN